MTKALQECGLLAETVLDHERPEIRIEPVADRRIDTGRPEVDQIVRGGIGEGGNAVRNDGVNDRRAADKRGDLGRGGTGCRAGNGWRQDGNAVVERRVEGVYLRAGRCCAPQIRDVPPRDIGGEALQERW